MTAKSETSRNVHLALLLAAAFLCGQASAASAVPTQLPRTVRPLHYDVSLDPDPGALTYSGHVAIDIEVLQPTDRITLNAADIRFTNVVLTGGGAPDSRPVGTEMRESDQTATFTFASRIPAGRHQLVLDYEGRINTQAYGLFAIDYTSAAGPRRALFTQFESGDARRVIPSWDEPAYKATFTLAVSAANGMMVVGNMPPERSEDIGGGRTRTHFAQTPKMSSYLVFFAVGDFERATAKADDAEVGVVTQRGLTAQAAFVLESSRAIMHEYDEYFGIPYALPKLDNVAAPGGSQQFGGMENWGAILTFEYAILLDPTIATAADTELAFTMAAHEMAHQWFGDLVTMQWWDDLWLNEGFASWMESRMTARLHPEWHTALQSVGGRDVAMERDALATTHPVVQHVETVVQADQAFDAITYMKGESVIHMLESYVGDDAWRAGVRAYMRDHAYDSTVSEDLWRAIEATAKLPVGAVAKDFTLQPGVPLIRVEAASCEGNVTKLRLTQGEYTKDRAGKRPLTWRVPLIAATVGGAAPARTLVEGGKATLEVPGCGPVIVNAGQSGYYRTLYGEKHFARVAGNFAAVAPIDQLGVLADSWALGLAGLQPVTDFLELAVATPVTAEPQVWRRIAGVLNSINDYYDGEPAQQARFRHFAAALLAPVMARVGWVAQPGERNDVAILRGRLIQTLGALGDPAVVAEARRRYAARESDPAALPVPLRLPVLGVVARHADAATWEELHAAARAEKSPLVRDRYYELLASAEDPALARRALELALTPEPGATTSPNMITAVAQLHPDLAFDFALGHLDAVMEKVDAPSQTRFLPSLAERSTDPAMIAKINAYAAAHLPASARRDAETAAAGVAYRVRVRAERLPAIDAWLPQGDITPGSSGTAGGS